MALHLLPNLGVTLSNSSLNRPVLRAPGSPLSRLFPCRTGSSAHHPRCRKRDFSLSRRMPRLVVRDLFEFKKSRQLFIGTHHETLFVTMCVGNPDHSPLRVQG